MAKPLEGEGATTREKGWSADKDPQEVTNTDELRWMIGQLQGSEAQLSKERAGLIGKIEQRLRDVLSGQK